jgi:hypothetical protein
MKYEEPFTLQYSVTSPKPVLSIMPLQKPQTQDLTVTITRNSGNYEKMEKKQKYKKKIWQSAM